MEINTSSWHYRLIKRFSGDRAPTNLCPYMRKVMAILLVVGFFAPSLVYGMIQAPFLVISPEWFKATWLNGIVADFGGLALTIHGMISVISGVAAWVILIFGILAAAVDAWRAHRETVKWEKNKKRKIYREEKHKPREPNIFKVWLTAIHDKACPIIEFKDK